MAYDMFIERNVKNRENDLFKLFSRHEEIAYIKLIDETIFIINTRLCNRF